MNVCESAAVTVAIAALQALAVSVSVVPPPLSESHRNPILGYQACLQTVSPQCLLTRLSPSAIRQKLLGGLNLLNLTSH